MRWLEVKSSKPLNGKIRIPGSKNSSLALLAASCMAEEPVHISKIPDISDIQVVFRIMDSIGVSVTSNNGTYTIDPSGIHTAEIDPALSSAFRAAYYFVGALLAKHRRVSIGYPGGTTSCHAPSTSISRDSKLSARK